MVDEWYLWTCEREDRMVSSGYLVDTNYQYWKKWSLLNKPLDKCPLGDERSDTRRWLGIKWWTSIPWWIPGAQWK